ncbi:hypothetical protein JOF48_003526 [Arthrobacter stackebrandtii]|uniref:Carrier domain-containing protein n=1 Tax=Arthrobacter stackebrandtii TaxID=272161 RepID=A0ABS4Z103_9MICC|nr:hypothetical protein [Arthrobacter stackebrandtii]MBP2414727.1 hypothetical protein [Arthrobacter stackebrandtii]PYH01811.1 hypothetical protein CVV67_05005 [Arthrobacter stackebrandtii]
MQPQPPPDNLFDRLFTTVPVALLPVRLETRFGTRRESADGPEIATLRLRIYPDDLSVDRGSPAFSEAEIAAAAAFWQAQQDHAGATAEDAARRGAAWELYVRHVGSAKAVHLALQTRGGSVPAAAADVPHAVLLPDSWVVVGENDGGGLAFVHHIEGVPGTLPLAPADPDHALDPADAQLVPKADPARWVSDFDAALACGMAAEIDLETTGEAASGSHTPAALHGLQALYVFGVGSADPDSTANFVAGLLSGHAAAAPLGFVAQGAATNNLGGAPSGWSAEQDEFDGFRFVTETAAAPAPLDPAVPALAGGAADGTVFEAALGLPPGTAAGFSGASGREAWYSRNFTGAFFPVTLGQALGDLARRTFEDPQPGNARARLRQETLLFARTHATSFVRSNGPIQPLRIGSNPYGILPVMATSGWVRVAGEDRLQGSLLDTLNELRWYFSRAAGSVPTMAAGTANAAAAMFTIFGRSPVPHEAGWWLRDVVGPMVGMMTRALDLGAAAGRDLDPLALLNGMVAKDSSLVKSLGLDAVRRVLSATLGDYFDGSLLVEMSTRGQLPVLRAVAQTATRAGARVTPSDYLGALLRRSTWRHGFGAPAPADPNPPDDLLYVVAERALEAAGELDAKLLLSVVNDVEFRAAMVLPPETDKSADPAAVQMGSVYNTKLSAVATAAGMVTAAGAGLSIHDAVWDDAVNIHGGVLASDAILHPWQEVNTLAGTRRALWTLAEAGLSDAEYTRMTSETLAASSHRLDAWYTSLATSRLATLRKGTELGLHAGAWGVLVNIRPQSTAAGAQATAAGSTGPVPDAWVEHLKAHGVPDAPELRIPADPLGYVHAPSLPQAVTAGILRAAEAAHAGGGSSLAGMDLTSKRVRAALDIVAAMGHGQPLGALLGQQLERRLNSSGLQTAVGILRELFPQRRTSGAAGEPAAGDDAVVPPEVVDGLDAWTGRAALAGMAGLEGTGPALQELGDAIESVADLLVADGVHQLSSGRLEHAGASFAAAADGAPLPDITVAAEPRSGVTITHRLMLSVDGSAGQPDGSGWNDAAPRAQLARGAEQWARGMLGPATGWTAAPSGAAEGAVVPLDSLGLCALDVVAESVPGPSGGCALDARCQVDPALLHMARAAASVLSQARPAVPADLDYPHPDPTLGPSRSWTAPAPGPAELSGLVGAVKAQLGAVVRGIAGVLAASATPSDGTSVPVPLEGVEVPATLLAPLAALGFPGCVVAGSGVSTSQALAAASSAGAVVRDVFVLLGQGRPNSATSTVPGGGAADAGPAVVGVDNWENALDGLLQSKTAIDTLVKVVRRLGGDAVVPSLELGLDSSAVVGVEQLELQRWLVRTSRVRPAMAEFVDLSSFAEAAGRPVPGLTAMHLPPTPALAWLGGPLEEADPPGPDARPNTIRRWKRPAQPHVHAVVSGVPVPDGRPTHLLVLDEVAEVLPAPTAATGLALNYNAPNARAPQSILLAVHPNPAVAPNPGVPWTWRLMLDTVREAVELAKIRGVDLDDLQQTGLGEFLPLIYLPDPPTSVLAMTPLAKLTEDRLRRLLTEKAYKNVMRLAP